ncbi:hypothetical protein V6N11_017293 [Hibiscus sabdariffa]|uniref:Cupin type-1 domain-containing protein n=1 Tax=Hibiscus sabdariffa TaxID=183260 RepID=A0ABR2TXY7_9ROSI
MQGVQVLFAISLLPLPSSGFLCGTQGHAIFSPFTRTRLNVPGNTSNQLGSKVTPVNVEQIPGLNTLGVSLARIDYAPYSLNPPHTHPRATEIIVLLEGRLYVGFVTSNPDYRLIAKVLYPGDVFVFPVGLIYFQFNIGKTNAIAFAGLSNQNPGVITIANAVFGSKQHINPNVLAKAFQPDKNVGHRYKCPIRDFGFVEEISSIRYYSNTNGIDSASANNFPLVSPIPILLGIISGLENDMSHHGVPPALNEAIPNVTTDVQSGGKLRNGKRYWIPIPWHYERLLAFSGSGSGSTSASSLEALPGTESAPQTNDN